MIRNLKTQEVIDLQMKIGKISIADIKFDDLYSRDEIPKLLQGLQQIYCNREISEQVFEILKKNVSAENFLISRATILTKVSIAQKDGIQLIQFG